MLRPGEPVFVPDPVEQWQSIVAPAIRISRLGMNIKPAFARQHYHEIAAVHLLMPRTVGPIPPLFCDRAIAPGKWFDIDSLSGKSFNASIATFDDDNTVTFSMPLCFSDLKADEAVHFVSRYMTLKTGDMIVFGDNALDLGHHRSTPCSAPKLWVCLRSTSNSSKPTHRYAPTAPTIPHAGFLYPYGNRGVGV